MLISKLKIRRETETALHGLGYTETGNFIEADNIILASRLTKLQYTDLATAMAEIKSGIFWDEIYNKYNKPTDNVLFPIGKLPFTFRLGKGKKLTFNKSGA